MPLPGVPTDVTVSSDGSWLAVIYTAADASGGRIAVFAVDTYSLAVTANPIGVASFNGVVHRSVVLFSFFRTGRPCSPPLGFWIIEKQPMYQEAG